MGAWQEWAPAAPDAMAASLLLNADGGTLRVRVFGAMAASEAETRRQLDELAAAAAPTAATVRTGSSREAKRFLSGLGEADEEDAGHPFSKSEFFAPAASLGGDRRAARAPAHRPRGRRARLLALGRRLHARRARGDRVRPSRRPLPAQARDRRRPRRDRRREGGRARLARALVGARAPVRDRRRLSQLPRSRPRRLGRRLPRAQPRAPARGQAPLRPRRRLRRGAALTAHSTADRSSTPLACSARTRVRANGCSSACSPSGLASTIVTAPPERSTAAGSA